MASRLPTLQIRVLEKEGDESELDKFHESEHILKLLSEYRRVENEFIL